MQETPSAQETPIYDRDGLGLGERIAGPAIIEQADTTTLVEPGWVATVHEAGAMILEREG
jgi:N-methylhydantoinase A/oxoprolinase/acetone carboxylase beta subunit